MDRVEQDCAVTIRFTMSTEISTGEFKERPEDEVRFIFGVEEQVPALEKILEGAGVGRKFSLQITCIRDLWRA